MPRVSLGLAVGLSWQRSPAPSSPFVAAVLPFWIQDQPDTSLVVNSVASNDFWDTLANLTKVQFRSPIAGTIQTLSLNSGVALGSGTITFTLSINGVDSGVAATMTAGGTLAAATGFAQALALDDLLALHASGSGLTSAPFIRGGCLGVQVAA